MQKKKKKTIPVAKDVGNQSKSHQSLYGFLNRSKIHEQPHENKKKRCLNLSAELLEKNSEGGLCRYCSDVLPL